MDVEELSRLATDVHGSVKIAKAAIGDLEALGPEVADVLKEFQGILHALTAEHQQETQTLDAMRKVALEYEEVRGALGESKTAVEEARVLRGQLQVALPEVGARLKAVTLRVEDKTKQHLEISAAIEAHQASLAGGPGWSPAQVEQRERMEATQRDLQAALDVQRSTQASLRRDVDHVMDIVEHGEKAKAESHGDVVALRQEISGNATKTAQMDSALGQLSVEMKMLQAVQDATQQRLSERQDQERLDGEGLAKKEALIRAKKSDLDRVLQEYNALHKRTTALTNELDSQMSTNEAVANDLRKMEERIQEYYGEEAVLNKETERLVALHGLATQKLADTSTRLGEVEAEAAELESKKRHARAQITEEATANVALESALSDLMKEREILRTSLGQLSGKTSELETLIRIQGGSQKLLESEISALRSSTATHRAAIDELHLENIELEERLAATSTDVATLEEQHHLQKVQERVLLKKTEEMSAKMKKQQGLYDGARDERNAYSLSLVELEAEIASVSRQFKDMTRRIYDHKGVISTKDHDLVTEHFAHHRVEREKEGLRSELMRVKRQIKSCDELMSAQDKESANLARVTEQAELECSRQNKEFREVVSERDALRAQVMQRDAELAALYEKLKIQASSLDKGSYVYRTTKQQEADVAQLVNKLKADVKMAKLEIVGVDGLKHEIIRLEKEIRQEQVKSAALAVETERPINVHRWRQFESSNPELYAKILRVQTLQRRLVQASEETAQRNALIKEKEALYKEMKALLDRQPSAEIAEQLLVYQQTMKMKQQQLKVMETELVACKGGAEEIKYEIESLNSEIARLNKRYLQQLSRDALP